MPMAAALAVFCHVMLLVINVVALPHRRLLLPLVPLRRRRLLRNGATILMVLGAAAIFDAVAATPNDDTSRALAAAAGFLVWVVGVALLLLDLTAGRRFPGPGAAAAGAPARLAPHQQLVQAAAGALF